MKTERPLCATYDDRFPTSEAQQSCTPTVSHVGAACGCTHSPFHRTSPTHHNPQYGISKYCRTSLCLLNIYFAIHKVHMLTVVNRTCCCYTNLLTVCVLDATVHTASHLVLRPVARRAGRSHSPLACLLSANILTFTRSYRRRCVYANGESLGHSPLAKFPMMSTSEQDKCCVLTCIFPILISEPRPFDPIQFDNISYIFDHNSYMFDHLSCNDGCTVFKRVSGICVC